MRRRYAEGGALITFGWGHAATTPWPLPPALIEFWRGGCKFLLYAGGSGGSMPPTKRSRLEGLVSAIALRATSNGGLSGLGFKIWIMKLPRARSTPSWPTCSLLALPRPSLEAKPPIPRCRPSSTARPQRESWGRIYTPSVPLPGTPPYQIGGWEGNDSQRIANPSLPWPGACLSKIGTRGRPPPGT
jgi:hypothetical protein